MFRLKPDIQLIQAPRIPLPFLSTLLAAFLAGCGGGGGPTTSSNTNQSLAQPSNGIQIDSSGPQRTPEAAPQSQYQASIFIGSTSQSGYFDGDHPQLARFTDIQSIAGDASGNLYVADSGAIRKISPSGEIKTIAGTFGSYGHADGAGQNALFGGVPKAGTRLTLAVDWAGTIYVADAPYIRKISPSGEVTTIAGTAESGTADGPVATARFSLEINGIAVDRSGNIFINEGDYLQPPNRVRKLSPDGMVSTVFDCGSLYRSCGNIQVDPAGNLYVQAHHVPQSTGDARFNSAASFYKVAPDGTTGLVAGIPSGYDRDLWLSLSQADRDGNLYFYQTVITTDKDFYSPKVLKREDFLQKMTPAGEITSIAPFSYETPAQPNEIMMVDFDGSRKPLPRHPRITVDSNGNIFFVGPGYIGKVSVQ